MINSTTLRWLKIRFIVCLVVLGVAVPATQAQDGGETINVAVLNLEGNDVDDELLETLTSVLRNEAQQHASYDIVNQSPINLSEIVVVLGCNTNNPRCLEQAADQLDARVLIYGNVEALEAVHKVTIEVFDASSGEVEQRLVRTLPDGEDPVVEFRRQLESLFTGEPVDDETRLRIGSSVEGAKIEINETMIGSAPIERKGLPVGSYDVRVYADGYDSWTATVELAAGDDVRLWAPLSKVKEDDGDQDAVAKADSGPSESGAQSSTGPGQADVVVGPPPSSGSGGTNIGAWSAVAVGGVALGGSALMGAMMLGAENDLIELDANSQQQDRDAYIAEREDIITTGESYELAHRVLLGVGALSVAGGTMWLLLDSDSNEQSTAQRSWDVKLSPRGVDALVRW
ncbi:MAG: PEGA domain-containing protein [Persicimonas sp.]